MYPSLKGITADTETPAINDPWSPVSPSSSSSQTKEEIFENKHPIKPINDADPWASFDALNNVQSILADDTITLQPIQTNGQLSSKKSLPSFGNEAGGPQRTNVKTPENFLGENSSLVNLDNLMGPASFQPVKPGYVQPNCIL